MKVTAGEFERFYDPSAGEAEPWYINDHCLIRGEGKWHLFGITHQEPHKPLEEIHCAHAVGSSLADRCWKKMPYPITADPTYGEAHFWAPHVLAHDGLYYMFWCAGSLTGHDTYRIHAATSPDLETWTRIAENPIIIDGYDARDPMVMRIGSKWVLYYTANATPTGGNHTVACVESDDLIHWSNKRTVFTDPTTGTYGGPTESPFVVQKDGKYYLFIGPRGDYFADYNKTEVFESDNPFSFSVENLVGCIPAHAAEVVADEDGQLYITRAGWGEGGVYLAPLYFNP